MNWHIRYGKIVEQTCFLTEADFIELARKSCADNRNFEVDSYHTFYNEDKKEFQVRFVRKEFEEPKK